MGDWRFDSEGQELCRSGEELRGSEELRRSSKGSNVCFAKTKPKDSDAWRLDAISH